MIVTTCIACRREHTGPGLQCFDCMARSNEPQKPQRHLEIVRDRKPMPAVLREKIDALLATPAGVTEERPKSTDPRDRMNKTEQRYADILDARLRAGEIVRWWFDDLVFRVGVGRSTYRPDFVVLLPDGSLEVVEIKGGHIWDDARVKFSAAAREYPIARWRMLQWRRGEWRILYDFMAMARKGEET